MVPREYDTFLYYRLMNRDLILEFMPCHHFRRSSIPMIPMERALPLFSVQRFRRFIDESSQGSREELVPQVISKPYDPSYVEYEASQAENVISPAAEVKQEVNPSASSKADKLMTNGLTSTWASMPAHFKIETHRLRNEMNNPDSESKDQRTKRTSPQR